MALPRPGGRSRSYTSYTCPELRRLCHPHSHCSQGFLAHLLSCHPCCISGQACGGSQPDLGSGWQHGGQPYSSSKTHQLNAAEQGEICDMNTLGIWEPFMVKAQTLKSSIEVPFFQVHFVMWCLTNHQYACMLLRIDSVLSGVAKKKEGPSFSRPSSSELIFHFFVKVVALRRTTKTTKHQSNSTGTTSNLPISIFFSDISANKFYHIIYTPSNVFLISA